MADHWLWELTEMYSYEQHITDTATPRLARAKVAARSKAIRSVMGRSGANHLSNHLEKLGRTRHRSNVAHNFYADAADATSFQTDDDGATVIVSKAGMAQRYHGGTIKAINKTGMLFIPIKGSEAEGKTPREFGRLQLIINKRTEKGVAKLPGKAGKVLFALVAEITQDPDHSVIPDDWMDNVNADTAKFMTRYWKAS